MHLTWIIFASDSYATISFRLRAFMKKYRISPRNHIQKLNPGKRDRRYASKGSSCIICNYKMRHAPNQHLHFHQTPCLNFELGTKNSSEFKLYDSASWSIADEKLWFFFFFLIKVSVLVKWYVWVSQIKIAKTSNQHDMAHMESGGRDRKLHIKHNLT